MNVHGEDFIPCSAKSRYVPNPKSFCRKCTHLVSEMCIAFEWNSTMCAYCFSLYVFLHYKKGIVAKQMHLKQLFMTKYTHTKYVGLAYEIYSGCGPSTYVYCVFCYRLIVAPYVRTVGQVFAYLYTLDDDSECPMDYETSLLLKVFPSTIILLRNEYPY